MITFLCQYDDKLKAMQTSLEDQMFSNFNRCHGQTTKKRHFHGQNIARSFLSTHLCFAMQSTSTKQSLSSNIANKHLGLSILLAKTCHKVNPFPTHKQYIYSRHSSSRPIATIVCTFHLAHNHKTLTHAQQPNHYYYIRKILVCFTP